MKNIQLPSSLGAASLNVEISSLEKTIKCTMSPLVHKSISVDDDTILIVVDAYSAGKQMINSWGLSFKEHDGLWRKFDPELHDIELLRAELAPKPELKLEPEPEIEPQDEVPALPMTFEETVNIPEKGCEKLSALNEQEAAPVEAKKKQRKLDSKNSASM